MDARDATVNVVGNDKLTPVFKSVERSAKRAETAIGKVAQQWGRNLSKMRRKTDDWSRSGNTSGKKFTKGMLAAFDTLASAGASIGGAMSKAISAAGPYVQIAAAALAVSAGVVMAPALAAAISGGLLLAIGGGVLAAGIMAAAKSPAVKAAWKTFGDRAKNAFKDFGKPFEGPVARAAKTFGDAVERMAPTIKSMGKSIAPIIDKLAPAFTSMAEKSLPGIKQALEQSKPLFDAIALAAPKIGEAISQFFGYIAKSGPSASMFFKDLFAVIGWVIKATGWLIGKTAEFYAGNRIAISQAATWFKNLWTNVKNWTISAFVTANRVVLGFFGTMLSAAVKAFSWVPGLGPKLRAAEAQFATFRDSVNAKLNAIKDRTVTIKGVWKMTKNNFVGPVAPGSAYAKFGGGDSWRAADTAAQFAAGGSGARNGGGGTSRTGGPTEVALTNRIYLDGSLIQASTTRTVTAAESRNNWRQKVGKR